MGPHTPPSPPRPAAHGALARRTRGFTLAELSIVVLIMGIVAAVGIIRLSRASVFMAEGQRVARRLVGDLRYAQSEAITSGKNHYLTFTEGVTKYTDYTIFRVEAGGDVQVEPTRVLPETVAVTGSATRAELTPTGDALASYTYTVTAPPGHSYTIAVVLATGAVTLQGP